jgi:hypothetical protein
MVLNRNVEEQAVVLAVQICPDAFDVEEREKTTDQK